MNDENDKNTLKSANGSSENIQDTEVVTSEESESELNSLAEVENGIRSRFNNLIEAQLERLRKLGEFSLPTRRLFVSAFSQTHSNITVKEVTSETVIKLKSYVGELSGILLAISDTAITTKHTQELIYNSAVMDKTHIWNAINSKLEELESDVSRYGREIIHSQLQEKQRQLSVLENEVKEILFSMKSHPASFLSQGDSCESIHAITETLQEKLVALQLAAQETGVLQGEAMFVSDLTNILTVVQNLSRDLQEQNAESQNEQSQNYRAEYISENVQIGHTQNKYETFDRYDLEMGYMTIPCEDEQTIVNSSEVGNEDFDKIDQNTSLYSKDDSSLRYKQMYQRLAKEERLLSGENKNKDICSFDKGDTVSPIEGENRPNNKKLPDENLQVIVSSTEKDHSSMLDHGRHLRGKNRTTVSDLKTLSQMKGGPRVWSKIDPNSETERSMGTDNSQKGSSIIASGMHTWTKSDAERAKERSKETGVLLNGPSQITDGTNGTSTIDTEKTNNRSNGIEISLDEMSQMTRAMFKCDPDTSKVGSIATVNDPTRMLEIKSETSAESKLEGDFAEGTINILNRAPQTTTGKNSKFHPGDAKFQLGGGTGKISNGMYKIKEDETSGWSKTEPEQLEGKSGRAENRGITADKTRIGMFEDNETYFAGRQNKKPFGDVLYSEVTNKQERNLQPYSRNILKDINYEEMVNQPSHRSNISQTKIRNFSNVVDRRDTSDEKFLQPTSTQIVDPKHRTNLIKQFKTDHAKVSKIPIRFKKRKGKKTPSPTFFSFPCYDCEQIDINRKVIKGDCGSALKSETLSLDLNEPKMELGSLSLAQRSVSDNTISKMVSYRTRGTENDNLPAKSNEISKVNDKNKSFINKKLYENEFYIHASQTPGNTKTATENSVFGRCQYRQEARSIHDGISDSENLIHSTNLNKQVMEMININYWRDKMDKVLEGSTSTHPTSVQQAGRKDSVEPQAEIYLQRESGQSCNDESIVGYTEMDELIERSLRNALNEEFSMKLFSICPINDKNYLSRNFENIENRSEKEAENMEHGAESETIRSGVNLPSQTSIYESAVSILPDSNKVNDVNNKEDDQKGMTCNLIFKRIGLQSQNEISLFADSSTTCNLINAKGKPLYSIYARKEGKRQKKLSEKIFSDNVIFNADSEGDAKARERLIDDDVVNKIESEDENEKKSMTFTEGASLGFTKTTGDDFIVQRCSDSDSSTYCSVTSDNLETGENTEEGREEKLTSKEQNKYTVSFETQENENDIKEAAERKQIDDQMIICPEKDLNKIMLDSKCGTNENEMFIDNTLQTIPKRDDDKDNDHMISESDSIGFLGDESTGYLNLPSEPKGSPNSENFVVQNNENYMKRELGRLQESQLRENPMDQKDTTIKFKSVDNQPGGVTDSMKINQAMISPPRAKQMGQVSMGTKFQNRRYQFQSDKKEFQKDQSVKLDSIQSPTATQTQNGKFILDTMSDQMNAAAYPGCLRVISRNQTSDQIFNDLEMDDSSFGQIDSTADPGSYRELPINQVCSDKNKTKQFVNEIIDGKTTNIDTTNLREDESMKRNKLLATSVSRQNLIARLPLKISASKSDSSIAKRKRKVKYPSIKFFHSTFDEISKGEPLHESNWKHRKSWVLKNSLLILLTMIILYLFIGYLNSVSDLPPILDGFSKTIELHYISFPTT